jgi:hypothetical protein
LKKKIEWDFKKIGPKFFERISERFFKILLNKKKKREKLKV